MVTKIKIRVIPNARKNEVRVEEDKFKVYVSALAIDGKANKAVIELLADFLKTKKSNIKIIQGEHSKEKIIEIYQP